MGDPVNYIGGTWLANSQWMESIEYISVSGFIVPLTTLTYELRINSELQNLERVEIIKECMTSGLKSERAPRG